MNKKELLTAAMPVWVKTTACVRLVETTRTGSTTAIWFKGAAQVGVLMAAAVGLEGAAKVGGRAAGWRAAAVGVDAAARFAPEARDQARELRPQPVQAGSAWLCSGRNRGEGAQQEEGCEKESWRLRAHGDSRESAPA